MIDFEAVLLPDSEDGGRLVQRSGLLCLLGGHRLGLVAGTPVGKGRVSCVGLSLGLWHIE